MVIKTTDIITTSGSVLTATWGITNIQEILGVIVLILSILNILINLVFKVRDRVNSKEYDKIDDDINEAVENIKRIKESDKDGHK